MSSILFISTSLALFAANDHLEPLINGRRSEGIVYRYDLELQRSVALAEKLPEKRDPLLHGTDELLQLLRLEHFRGGHADRETRPRPEHGLGQEDLVAGVDAVERPAENDVINSGERYGLFGIQSGRGD